MAPTANDVKGSLKPLIEEDRVNLIFPKMIADCMNLEGTTNLYYKISGKELIIPRR